MLTDKDVSSLMKGREGDENEKEIDDSFLNNSAEVTFSHVQDMIPPLIFTRKERQNAY